MTDVEASPAPAAQVKEELPPQDMACPFCGDRDFDAVGLKIHLTAGHCEVFTALEVGNRVY